LATEILGVHPGAIYGYGSATGLAAGLRRLLARLSDDEHPMS